MSLAEFFKELAKHDWYYAFSDDRLIYRRGEENQRRLSVLAQQSEMHQKIFDAFKDYFSDHEDDTRKKPEIEDYAS